MAQVRRNASDSPIHNFLRVSPIRDDLRKDPFELMASKNMAILFGVLAIRFAVAVVPSSDAPVRRQRLGVPGQALNEDANKRSASAWTLPWKEASSGKSCTDACTITGMPYARCEANSTYQGTGDDIKAHYGSFSGGTETSSSEKAPFVGYEDGDEYLFRSGKTDSAPDGYCDGSAPDKVGNMNFNRVCNCGCVDCSVLKRASNETES